MTTGTPDRCVCGSHPQVIMMRNVTSEGVMDLNRINRLEELLAKNPGDTILGYGLGSAYRESGDLPKAREVLEEVVRQKPDYAAAWEVLGLTLEEMGQREEAIRIYEQGIRISREGGFLAPEKQMSRRLKRLLAARPGSNPTENETSSK